MYRNNNNLHTSFSLSPLLPLAPVLRVCACMRGGGEGEGSEASHGSSLPRWQPRGRGNGRGNRQSLFGLSGPVRFFADGPPGRPRGALRATLGDPGWPERRVGTTRATVSPRVTSLVVLGWSPGGPRCRQEPPGNANMWPTWRRFAPAGLVVAPSPRNATGAAGARPGRECERAQLSPITARSAIRHTQVKDAMLNCPRPGQRVMLRYRRPLRDAGMPHGVRGVVLIVGRGPGPRNHLIRLDDGRHMAVPAGHVFKEETHAH